jgi:threonine/homoserine/homoserine lactone efflux protein
MYDIDMVFALISWNVFSFFTQRKDNEPSKSNLAQRKINSSFTKTLLINYTNPARFY